MIISYLVYLVRWLSLWGKNMKITKNHDYDSQPTTLKKNKQKVWWCWWGIWGWWLHNYGQGEHLPAHTLQLKTCRTPTMIHPPMFSICGDFYTLYKNQSTLPMQLIQAYAKRTRLCRLKCNSCNTSDTIVDRVSTLVCCRSKAGRNWHKNFTSTAEIHNIWPHH